MADDAIFENRMRLMDRIKRLIKRSKSSSFCAKIQCHILLAETVSAVVAAGDPLLWLNDPSISVSPVV